MEKVSESISEKDMSEKVRFVSEVAFYELIKEGNSAQAHIKEMTELFDILSVAEKQFQKKNV